MSALVIRAANHSRLASLSLVFTTPRGNARVGERAYPAKASTKTAQLADQISRVSCSNPDNSVGNCEGKREAFRISVLREARADNAGLGIVHSSISCYAVNGRAEVGQRTDFCGMTR